MVLKLHKILLIGGRGLLGLYVKMNGTVLLVIMVFLVLSRRSNLSSFEAFSIAFFDKASWLSLS